MHVKPQFPGLGLALPVVGGEVIGGEFDAKLFCQLFPGLENQGGVLVGAYRQCGAEGVKPVLGGVAGGLVQPDGVAVATAVFDVGRHRLDEGAKAVLVLLHQSQADGLGVFPEAVAPGAVLGEGVDVGVVPEAGGFDALPPELFDAGH